MYRRVVLLRLTQLLVGLSAYGFSVALMLRSGLGLQPWDVLHEGLAQRSGFSFGLVAVATGAVVLMLWLPLGERPGVGTLGNVLIVGTTAEAVLSALPDFQGAHRWGALSSAVALNAAATAAYMGAGLGPGPRDGLMAGIVRRTGGSVGVVRAGIETAVLGVGWLLGGTVGPGTIVYALAVGPLVHRAMPLFARCGGRNAPAKLRDRRPECAA